MECLKQRFKGGVILDGRYRTISPLNHGSFGMVFMAEDLVNNRTVAIKCMTKKAAPHDGMYELAVDENSEELVLHCSLGNHKHIVNLLDSFDTDAHFYLVLEYCSQGDLYEAISNGHGPLQTEHVRQFMLQLVDAVSYIHSQGVYHRDIKPENIFLTQDGAMKLGDFGLATRDKWSYETSVGSDRYMAPEQFDSAGAGYSPAGADIWAIGICLLNILFSRNPFTTPTEADPLFLDFSRDKQSLFDVFPSMSQDTYEVIVQCMNLDPRRRSLEGARDALLGVASFTTEDELLDDFCGAETATVASANREPLRTPSLQAPHLDHQTGAFPWAKALHGTSPHHVRQLSVISDTESYSEDLFSKSSDTIDWCSASIQTPSMPSVLTSQLNVSMRPLADSDKPYSHEDWSSAAGSRPITMAKPLALSTPAVIGRPQDGVSKSWSDMWDEDEEEQSKGFQSLLSRTRSHDSRSKPKKASNVRIVPTPHVTIEGDVDDEFVADGFFFQDSPASKSLSLATPRYSPPSKRVHHDKWAVLGERRRGRTPADLLKSPGPRPPPELGLGYLPQESGAWNYPIHHNRNLGRERGKEFPQNKCRNWNWRRDYKPADFGDIEWVGGF
ncbi:hypothetical protein E4U30_004442 [Claviceps sp. LM220 group G6]|nr:hypothetical protein E4U30_004442 [Claviceps sp. LM220 group G6]KAG6099778.1 hypothetical protein E4U31_004276 [Claviceps sp. LM219 group G6]KAG6119091.1 hypothetical protein E4U14_005895 [Claviceps sp. LM454 group G7]